MHVTRSATKPLFTYKLHGTILKNFKEAKYLGVTLDHKLSWNKHVDNVVAKANSTLGMARRNLKPAPQAIKQQAYFALTRPHVEYASCTWDPYSDRNIRQVDMVQRRAARFVTNRYHNTSSVSDMLEMLSWQSLKQRRLIARTTLLYKTINGLVALPSGPDYLPRNIRITRHSNQDTFIHYSTSTDSLKYSFYPRTIVDWNKLPAEVREATSADAFRAAVAKAL